MYRLLFHLIKIYAHSDVTGIKIIFMFNFILNYFWIRFKVGKGFHLVHKKTGALEYSHNY